jgi:hypothetical protein
MSGLAWERIGLGVCPTGNGTTGKPSLSATNVMFGSARAGQERFPGRSEGCISRVRSFCLQFFARRKSEGHGGPRRRAVVRHRELTERVIRSAIEVHLRNGAGLLQSFYAAALCRELERADTRVRREVGIPAIYKGEPLRWVSVPISWRMKPLSCKSKRFPRCCRHRTCSADLSEHECKPTCARAASRWAACSFQRRGVLGLFDQRP